MDSPDRSGPDLDTRQSLSRLLTLADHQDGHKREYAVHHLSRLGHPDAIPKLLVRANDWVAQVRSAARDALRQMLRDDNAWVLIHYLPALHHLRACRRADHSELITAITGLLLKPHNRHLLRAAIDAEERGVARIAARICAEHALIDTPERVLALLSHRDDLLRRLAARMLRDLSDQQLPPLLARAMADPLMPVRREALRLTLERFPAEAAAAAERMAFDGNGAIRELAIAHLRSQGCDVAQRYLETLAAPAPDPSRLPSALLGLAHLQAAVPLPLLLRFSEHPRPGVRRAALRALVRLAEEAARERLLAALRDPSPRNAREAATLLKEVAARPTPEALWAIIEEAPHDHTLRACLSAARLLGKWDRLIFLLRANLRAADQDRRDVALELAQWERTINRSAGLPTVRQKALLRTLMAQSGVMREAMRQSIELMLRQTDRR